MFDHNSGYLGRVCPDYRSLKVFHCCFCSVSFFLKLLLTVCQCTVIKIDGEHVFYNSGIVNMCTKAQDRHGTVPLERKGELPCLWQTTF